MSWNSFTSFIYIMLVNVGILKSTCNVIYTNNLIKIQQIFFSITPLLIKTNTI